MTQLPAPEPTTLPIHCALCGGAVTLQLTDWPLGERLHSDQTETVLVHQEWLCPYCGKTNGYGFEDRIAWVTEGHEPETPKPQ